MNNAYAVITTTSIGGTYRAMAGRDVLADPEPAYVDLDGERPPEPILAACEISAEARARLSLNKPKRESFAG